MKVYIGKASLKDKMVVEDADFIVVCDGPNSSPVMIVEAAQGNTGLTLTTNDVLEELAARLRAHGFTVTKKDDAPAEDDAGP